MFGNEHTNAIRNVLLREIPDIIEEKARLLEEEYERAEYIENAEVNTKGEEVEITLNLTFEPRDEEQNIPAVFEYGGVIYDKEDNAIEIQPGLFIRRIFANGTTK